MKYKVVIDPCTRIIYASYYIQGIISVFGKESILFDSRPFEFITPRNKKDFDHIFLFQINSGQFNINCVIDFHDSSNIHEASLKWCDVYGKVNIREDYQDESKVISIAPGFAIKTNLFSGVMGLFHYVNNYRLIKKDFRPGFRSYFSGFFSRKRLSIDRYRPYFGLDANYLFFISTLWKHESCQVNTNPWRLAFIERAKANSNNNYEFEGGFFIPYNSEEKYLAHKVQKKYRIEEYLDKINKSFLVFNTPAVHNCHGWKLPEYLLLGKAIISTPITNKLPAPLTHGENIHFVSTPDEIPAAIDLIKNDVAYRNKLAQGAREYYRTYISPESAVDAIVFHYLKEKNGI